MSRNTEGFFFDLVTIPLKDGKMTFEITIHGQCRMCGEFDIVPVSAEQFQDWANGEKLIQDIFPELNSDSREFLISRTCGNCFETLWNELEEEA